MSKNKNTAKVLSSIKDERARQDAKWGADRVLTISKWHLILSEEVGEVAKSVLGHEPEASLRAELVQVAAVAVATIEAIDSGNLAQ